MAEGLRCGLCKNNVKIAGKKDFDNHAIQKGLKAAHLNQIHQCQPISRLSKEPIYT